MATKSTAAAPTDERTAVLVVPDLGLTKAQISAMSRKFKAQIVESMGGNDAVTAARIRITIRVVVSTGGEQV